jgi:hypothetical protein
MTKQIVIVIGLAALALCLSSGAYASQQNSLIVTVYSAPDFKGDGRNYAPGHYAMPDGFNASSIRVPQGLVVIAYEYFAGRTGYGKWVDFLEDQPNLTNYDLGKRISGLYIFNKRNPDGSSWVRNTSINGRFIEGGWFKPRVPGEKPPRNEPIAVVAPPKPAPPPTTCTISGRVEGDRPAYGTHINLFVPGERNPRVSVSVVNGQYTIPTVPEGSFEGRGKMDNPMTHQTTRGPVGLKAIALDDQAVTCEKGQPVRVNFKIVSSE